MKRKTDKYAQFADHPRYGKRPNITGLNPSPMDKGVNLHWNATTQAEIVAQYEAVIGKRPPFVGVRTDYEQPKRIPNTAIAADVSRQATATVPVTHYFDIQQRCRDCNRLFIFFAEEQKYWYEELGLGLESDCVRCVDCRKQQQAIAYKRRTYESLFHVANKSDEQLVEMAEACLWLIEHDIFTTRQTERVRMLLMSVSSDADIRKRSRYTDLFDRLLAVEEDPDG